MLITKGIAFAMPFVILEGSASSVRGVGELSNRFMMDFVAFVALVIEFKV